VVPSNNRNPIHSIPVMRSLPGARLGIQAVSFAADSI